MQQDAQHYTVIPNDDGLQSTQTFFSNRCTIQNPSTETLLRLAELILTLSCFTFSKTFFKQINGVAMGAKMSPNYANLWQFQ